MPSCEPAPYYSLTPSPSTPSVTTRAAAASLTTPLSSSSSSSSSCRCHPTSPSISQPPFCISLPSCLSYSVTASPYAPHVDSCIPTPCSAQLLLGGEGATPHTAGQSAVVSRDARAGKQRGGGTVEREGERERGRERRRERGGQPYLPDCAGNDVMAGVTGPTLRSYTHTLFP